ncbi:MAG: ACT domain-containing protein [Thermoproteota archaeon]|jgi:aspartokinase|nr:ACT domain-containing protein [Thermoproteota archaeon]MDQ3561890.1 ACT domain-containing protein [Thermoproteota archaeon]MDQ5830894.1 ACT domain-containing protein [Thermoproteota archaeon]MDQ5860332.1 ACT domain-containing protein [Thermoproteota archaeon]MDQ5875309.1 ACT domain-containing protein [Thermoproteota archaeon]
MLASNEKSITEAVREIVSSDLSFQDSLQRDYCNISALARIIKPQIDHMLSKDTSIESVVTALKRSRYDYDVPQKPIASILAASTITVNTDVAKISAKKSKKTIEKVAKAMVQSVGNFISISESIMSITLVFEDLVLQDIKMMFAYDDILEIEDNLAAIIVHSPEDIIKTPGCAIAFYNQLARRHINIEDTVSCYTDTIVLVKMEQVGKAFNALTDLISNSRKMAKKKHR